MKAIPKHFKLAGEGPDHYEIHDARDKKHFRIAKRDLSLAMHEKLAKIQKFDAGGTAAGGDSADTADGAGMNDPASPGGDAPPVTVNVNQAPAPAITPPPVVASGATPPMVPTVTAPPAVQPGGNLVRQAGNAQSLSEKGILEGNQAAAQEQGANVGELQKHNERMQAIVDGYKTSRAALDTENKNLTQAVIDQKIDPDHYWHTMSLPGKVSTALGIILGGIGAGMQHSTTNQALEVVQTAIKQDIEAQRADLGKKQSLLSMNLEKYRSLDAATTATMAQMNAMVEGQLKLNAAKSGSQRAQAAADQAIGMNRMKYITELPGLAMSQYKMNVLNELSGGAPVPSAGERIANPQGGAASPMKTQPGAPAPRGPQSGWDSIPVGGVAFPGEAPKNGIPAAPAAVTPDSVDLKKLFRLKAAGLIEKEDGTAAGKEAAAIQENSAAKALIKNEWDRMETAVNDSPEVGGGVGLRRVQDVLSKAPLVGPMVGEANSFGGGPGRQFAAARANATNIVNTLLTKRIGGEGMANVKLDMPSGQETKKELQDKLKRVYDLIDKNTSTTTLQQYGLLKKGK